MKTISKYLSNALLLVAALLSSSCEGEKEMIIIDELLPIKTSTFYMVGDATPNGWSIDAPTALTQNADDPMIFTYEGVLNPGEMKCCLTTGSWDVPFVRPLENGTQITKAGMPETTFGMHAGDPDDKWRVVDKAIYRLTFNMRNWTIAVDYISDVAAPAKTPIDTDVLFMMGDATPGGWSLDNLTSLTKDGYIFTYEGALTAGELKCCFAASYDGDFIRPTSNGVEINKSGVASPDFTKAANPDDKWRVTEAGIYRLTFDLENWTIAAEYKGEIPAATKSPIDTDVLYMMGDATPGGWSLDAITELTKDANNGYIFTFECKLTVGDLKCCFAKSFDGEFIRPTSNGVEINKDGVANSEFTKAVNPDDKWHVSVEGIYRLTFDLENWTIAAEYKGEEPTDPDVPEGAILTDVLYMMGDATPGGWSLDAITELTKSDSDRFIFTYEGALTAGELKFCFAKSFDGDFIRPEVNGTEITKAGLATQKFAKWAGDPDNKWRVVDAGNYRITLNLRDLTIEVVNID